MNTTSLLIQALNGLELSVLLILIASGLALGLRIMNFLNLAHASFYMVGAYLAAALSRVFDNFLIAAGLALAALLAIAVGLDGGLYRFFYRRSRIWQLMATFGVVLILNDLVATFWSDRAPRAELPPWVQQPMTVMGGLVVPAYRMAMIAAGALAVLGLYYVLQHTHFGMRARAAASDAEMASAAGINARPLYTGIFVGGAGLAALAGVLSAPAVNIEAGMADNPLILSFLAIAIAGIGSLRALFIAAVIVGFADTLGRAITSHAAGMLLPQSISDLAQPVIGAVFIYALIAIILAIRPMGFVPGPGRNEG